MRGGDGIKGLTGYISCTACRPQGALHLNDSVVPQPQLLHLSAERLSRDGAFLMDCGYVSFHPHAPDVDRVAHCPHLKWDYFPLQVFYLWVGKCCSEMFIRDVLGCPDYASIPSNMVSTTVTPLKSHINWAEAQLQITMGVEGETGGRC